MRRRVRQHNFLFCSVFSRAPGRQIGLRFGSTDFQFLFSVVVFVDTETDLLSIRRHIITKAFSEFLLPKSQRCKGEWENHY